MAVGRIRGHRRAVAPSDLTQVSPEGRSATSGHRAGSHRRLSYGCKTVAARAVDRLRREAPRFEPSEVERGMTPRPLLGEAGDPSAPGSPYGRRATDRMPIPTVARWPLDVDPGFERLPFRDAWVSLVRDSMVAYREGRTDVAQWSWAPDIVWRAKGSERGEELRGAEQIFAYHRRLAELSDDTFRQRVVALQGSQGPVVEAFLRSTARVGDRRLDMPTLVMFELSAGRIQRVTEMPGDPVEWEDYWSAAEATFRHDLRSSR